MSGISEEGVVMAGYSVAHLSEVGEVQGEVPVRAIRQHFQIMSFGASAAFERAAGETLIKEHAEADADSGEELYVVISGEARFSLDGETRDAPAGTLVHVGTGVTRSAVALQDATTVLSIGAGPPGRPYAPSGWELFAPLFPLFESGEYELGADRAQALIADDPPYGAVYYNTACFESRCGRLEDALVHLRRAVELDPVLAGMAPDDEDLVALRERPEFAEIIAGAAPG